MTVVLLSPLTGVVIEIEARETPGTVATASTSCP